MIQNAIRSLRRHSGLTAALIAGSIGTASLLGAAAPPSALAMLILVTRKRFPAEARPGRWLRWTAWGGLAFLVWLTVLFLSSLLA